MKPSSYNTVTRLTYRTIGRGTNQSQVTPRVDSLKRSAQATASTHSEQLDSIPPQVPDKQKQALDPRKYCISIG